MQSKALCRQTTAVSLMFGQLDIRTQSSSSHRRLNAELAVVVSGAANVHIVGSCKLTKRTLNWKPRTEGRTDEWTECLPACLTHHARPGLLILTTPVSTSTTPPERISCWRMLQYLLSTDQSTPNELIFAINKIINYMARLLSPLGQSIDDQLAFRHPFQRKAPGSAILITHLNLGTNLTSSSSRHPASQQERSNKVS